MRVLIFCVCLVAGVAIGQTNKDEAEIISVLKAKHVAFVEFSNRVVRTQMTLAPWQRYVRDLKAIDETGCPADFRRAWKQYLESCSKAQTSPLIKFLFKVLARDASVLDDNPDIPPRVAWRKVCSRAGAYGITDLQDPL